jgi:hypothetical protein
MRGAVHPSRKAARQSSSFLLAALPVARVVGRASARGLVTRGPVPLHLPGEYAALSAPTSKAGRLQRACLALLQEHEADGMLPTSGRFLWYELVQRQPQLVAKDQARGHPGVSRGIDQDVNDALMHLRRTGVVPWDWIDDETRTMYMYSGYASIAVGVQARVETVRLDPWAGEPEPLLLTESRSLAGVLQQVAADYCCSMASTNGQVGGFLHTVIVPVLREQQRVLYLGDLDLAGGQIEANTRQVLERATPLRWERLALTPEQVERYGLRPLVIVKRDRRYTDGRPHEAVETEALSQRVIVELVQARLDELLPAPLKDVLVREQRQRAAVRKRLSAQGGA